MTNKIIALHGFSASKEIFISVKRNLKKHKIELIPIDLPGHGENLPNLNKPLPQSTYSIDYYAEEVIKKLKALNVSSENKINLLGHSFGGGVAIVIAHKAPELINSLCLAAPGGIYTKDTERAYQLLGGTGANAKSKELKGLFHVHNKEDLYNMLEHIYHKKINLPESEELRIIDHYTKYSKWYTKLIKDTPWYNWQNLSPDERHINSLNEYLPKINVPTLLIWGEEDALLQINCSKYVKQQIKGSVLKIIEKVGHSPLQENPKETTEIINNFLSHL